jgi:hypothetical protein
MPSSNRAKRVPLDLKREVLDLAVLHLNLDRSWQGRDLGGETRDLSEQARLAAIDLLTQMLTGKRPRPLTPVSSAKLSAEERYVTKIKKALGEGIPSIAGIPTMDEAYRFAAGTRNRLAAPDDARVREAKRAWQSYWNQLSAGLGKNRRLRNVPQKELAAWLGQQRPK